MKLTKAMKQDMLRVIEIRLGAVTFGEQKKVADRLACAMRDAGQKLVEKVYPPADMKLIASYLDRNTFHSKTNCEVNHNFRTPDGGYNAHRRTIEFHESLVPHRYYTKMPTVGDDPYWELADAYDKAQKEWLEAVSTALIPYASFINSSTTIKQVVDLVPELSKFNRPGTALANVSAETIATIKKDQANVAAH